MFLPLILLEVLEKDLCELKKFGITAHAVPGPGALSPVQVATWKHSLGLSLYVLCPGVHVSTLFQLRESFLDST